MRQRIQAGAGALPRHRIRYANMSSHRNVPPCDKLSRGNMSHSQVKIPSLKFAQSISTMAAKGEDMFAKLKESKLLKLLSGVFCFGRKGCAKEGAAAGFGETKKAEEKKGSSNPKSEITIS